MMSIRSGNLAPIEDGLEIIRGVTAGNMPMYSVMICKVCGQPRWYGHKVTCHHLDPANNTKD